MQLSIANSVLFTSMIQSAIQGTDSFFQPSPLHTTPKHQVAYQPLTSPGAGSSNWHITRSDTNLQTPALVSKGKLLFESMRLQSSPEDITTELQKFYQERLDGIECPDCSTTGGRNEALTKIIATIGPASIDVDTLTSIIKEGADVIRINCAHADKAFIETAILNTNLASNRAGKQVATLLDAKGPEIRTGTNSQKNSDGQLITDQPLTLNPGDFVDFVTQEGLPLNDNIPSIKVNYGKITELPKDTHICINSGTVQLKVVSNGKDWVRAITIEGGEFGERRPINLPGTYVDLPALTEKDRTDIKIAVDLGVTFIALSFVRSEKDLIELQDYLDTLGSNAKKVAKLEDRSAIQNLKPIIKEADSIMIARGDLGVEASLEQLPALQLKIASACHELGKPFIIATEMLESMTNNPKPTRAEVSDVAGAVTFNQADTVMLSGETAQGRYPVSTVATMRKIIKAAEATDPEIVVPSYTPQNDKEHLISLMVKFASDINSPTSLVVFTEDGSSARTLAALRPDHSIPIYAFTNSKEVASQLRLTRGVQPFVLSSNFPLKDQNKYAIEGAVKFLENQNFVEEGEKLVLLTKSKSTGKSFDAVTYRTIGE